MGARVYLPTLGRFTQRDPILGGTANDYVYALDPINQSDYSGQSLLGTLAGIVKSIVSALVPKAVVAVVTAVVRAVSAAVSTVQARSAPPVARAAAKPADNATKAPPLPVAPGKVDAAWLQARTAEANKSIPYQSGPTNLPGYSNAGLEFTWIVGGTIGLKSDATGHHFYFGPCVGGRGPGGSLTGSTSNISTGLSVDVSVMFPSATGFSTSLLDESTEVGVGAPGVSGCVTWTF